MADLVQKPIVDEEGATEPGKPEDAGRSLDLRTTALTSAAALVGLIAAVSQLIGWIDVTLRTLGITLLVAAVFVLVAPPYIARQHEKNFGTEPPRRTIRWLAAGSAVLLVLAIAAPVTVRFAQARSAATSGTDHFHTQRYAAALPDLQRAARTYRSIGLDSRAVPLEIRLYHTLAALGRLDEAGEVGADLRDRDLSDHHLGLVVAAEANIAFTLGEFERAQTLYQQARQLVDSGSNDEATLLLDEAALLLARGSFRDDTAVDDLERAMAIYDSNGDRLGRAYVLAADAGTRSVPAERQELLDEARVIAEEEGDLGLVARIEAEVARSLSDAGATAEARDHYEAALTGFEELADIAGQAVVYANLAILEAESGEHAVARAYLSDAEALFTHFDLDGNDAPPRRLAHLYDLSGTVAETLGDRDLAEQRYRTALEILDENPDPLLRVEVLTNYATFAQVAGDLDAAELRYDEAQSLLERLIDTEVSPRFAILLVNRSALAAERGDLVSATEHVTHAVDVAEASGDQNVYEVACLHYDVAVAVGAVQDGGARCDGITSDGGSQVDLLLLEYNSTPEAVDIAEQLLEMVDDASLPPTEELLILTSIIPNDLITLGRLGPVDARLAEILATERITDEERALALGQRARIADRDGRPNAADLAEQAIALTDSLPVPQRPGWRLSNGYIVAMNADVESGIAEMWAGFHEGQSSVFADMPVMEFAYASQLDTVLLIHIDGLDPDEQRAQVDLALANAVSVDGRAILETMLETIDDFG